MLNDSLFGIIDLIIKLYCDYYVSKWDNLILGKYLKILKSYITGLILYCKNRNHKKLYRI